MANGRVAARRAWAVVSTLSVLDWLLHIGPFAVGSGVISTLAGVALDLPWPAILGIAVGLLVVGAVVELGRLIRRQVAHDKEWIGHLRQLVGLMEAAYIRFMAYQRMPDGYADQWLRIKDAFSREHQWGGAYQACDLAMTVIQSVDEEMAAREGAHPASVDNAISTTGIARRVLDVAIAQLERRLGGDTIPRDA